MENLTYPAVEAAYKTLDPHQKEVIDRQAHLLSNAIGGGSNPFGKQRALELLAALGIWMVENKIGETK
jgi:hypothetical protein